MSIVYSCQETFDELMEEGIPLFHAHGEEVDLYQEYFQVSPDYDMYNTLSDLGVLHITTARDEEQGGQLVGYLFFFVNNHPHYKEVVYANNDLIYVDPSCRGKGVAKGMFSAAEEDLKEGFDVSVISFHMKSAHPFKELAESMGYEEAEIMYSKYVKEEVNS